MRLFGFESPQPHFNPLMQQLFIMNEVALLLHRLTTTKDHVCSALSERYRLKPKGVQSLVFSLTPAFVYQLEAAHSDWQHLKPSPLRLRHRRS